MDIAAAYIRVSTDKQDELSPDAQLRLLKEYASAHDLYLPDEFIYREIGISGRKAERRPEFMKMIAQAKTKPASPFQTILVWKFSRFARNQEESIVYKSLLKKQCSVEVVSVSEPLVDGPFGTLIERIIEWMDEYYSIRLSGEVLRGMTEKAMRGGFQSYAPFGYKLVNHELVPDPETKKIVQSIFQQYRANISLTEIAHRITDQGYRTKFGNAFERRNIEYILQNPVYIGKVLWSKNGRRRRDWKESDDVIVAEGSHEPIITKEEFEEVQKIIHLKREMLPKNSRPTNEYVHWLSGLMKCGSCGSSMTVAHANGQRAYAWQCRNYSRGRCRVSHSITTKKLEAAVLSQLKQDSIPTADPDVHYIPTDTNLDELNQIRLSLSRIPGKLQRVKEAFAAGIDTLQEYADNKAKIQKEEQELRARMEQLQKKKEPTNIINFAERIRYVVEILESDAYTIEDKRNAIRSVVEKIIYHKSSSSLEIVYYTHE